MKRDKKGRFLPAGKKAKPRHHSERYVKREVYDALKNQLDSGKTIGLDNAELIDKISDAFLDGYTIACRMKGDIDKRSACFKEFLKSLSIAI
jgi:hypothetical protein